jgi:hypothetical protein
MGLEGWIIPRTEAIHNGGEEGFVIAAVRKGIANRNAHVLDRLAALVALQRGQATTPGVIPDHVASIQDLGDQPARVWNHVTISTTDAFEALISLLSDSLVEPLFLYDEPEFDIIHRPRI